MSPSLLWREHTPLAIGRRTPNPSTQSERIPPYFRHGVSIRARPFEEGIMATITGFHHLSLTVRDAAKSVAFYASVFGFVPVLELPDVEGRGLKRVLAHPESRAIL